LLEIEGIEIEGLRLRLSRLILFKHIIVAVIIALPPNILSRPPHVIDVGLFKFLLALVMNPDSCLLLPVRDGRLILLVVSVSIWVVLVRRRFLILLRLRLGGLALIYKRLLGPLHVIEVLKWLIVNPELKVVAMLHYVEHVGSYLEGVLECSAELLSLKN
jgi:hypothetical protein